jgi:hypothetical protein
MQTASRIEDARGSAFADENQHNELSLEETERKWVQHADRIKERTYDINLATASMIPYDPLADDHLQDFFNSPHTRKHLLKLGLVSENNPD